MAEVTVGRRNLCAVINDLEGEKKLIVTPSASHDLQVLVREMKKLEMKGGVLHRRVEDENGNRWQLVVPKSHRKQALEGVHEGLFHTHYDDAIVQLRMRLFWPYMAKDLKSKIKHCGRCVRRGALAQKAPMQSTVTTFPLELLSIDFLIRSKREEARRIGGSRPFHKVCTSHLDKRSNSKDCGKSSLDSVFHDLWFSKQNPFRPRERF